MVTEIVTFPRKEGWSRGRAVWSRDSWSWVKCREAALGHLGTTPASWTERARLGIEHPAHGFIALWKGRNAMPVVVKPLSSTGESSAMLSPG